MVEYESSVTANNVDPQAYASIYDCISFVLQGTFPLNIMLSVTLFISKYLEKHSSLDFKCL